MKTNFLNTIWGSYIKAFFVILLSFVIQSGDIWHLNWKEVLSASVISFLPMIAKAITGETGGFWNTAYGTYLKTAITLVIAFIVQSGSIYAIDLHTLVNVLVTGLAPVLINAANPNDPRYGLSNSTDSKS